MKQPSLFKLFQDAFRQGLRHPKYRWALIAGTLFYLVSPLDLAPDVLPIAGWIDDGVLVTFLISEVCQLMLENKKTAPQKKLLQPRLILKPTPLFSRPTLPNLQHRRFLQMEMNNKTPMNATFSQIKTESGTRSQRIAKILKEAFTQTSAELKEGYTIVRPLAAEMSATVAADLKEKRHQASSNFQEAWG